jgi:two-component system, NarL family, nitrate/nitrite response regulator NarL
MESSAAVALEPIAAAELPRLIRVLVVDDEPLFVELVETMLGAEHGIEIVGVAADGEQGVRLAAELEPDVIVMDISMPVMNGIDATREIRKHDPEARILILTGGASVEEIDEARAAGAAAYLTKDRIASEFVTEIRELADR